MSVKFVESKYLRTYRGNSTKVPENLSIVSFDDSQLALASEIKLTTIAHPKEFLGIEAGKAMLPIIERRQKFNNLKMEPKLIIRNSAQRMLR